MTGHLLRTLCRTARVVPKSLTRSAHASAVTTPGEHPLVGKREIVGFGFNGHVNYDDRVDFPCPAVRFMADTAEIKSLREKEKGDWKKLTIEEKKKLYRASFCQTFAEINAPTGEWKTIIGSSLVLISLALWMYMGMKKFVFSPLPESFNLENQQAQLMRMLELKMNPIEGISSKYDYEKKDWK